MVCAETALENIFATQPEEARISIMSDQDISNTSEEKARAKRMSGKQNVPREPRARRSLVDITALIRSVQLAEGNPDCFRKAEEYCDQAACDWRTYCLETRKAP